MLYVLVFMALLFVSHVRVLFLFHNLHVRLLGVEEGWEYLLVDHLRDETWLWRELERIKELVEYYDGPLEDANDR
jgi:hypothetical protein